MTGPSNPSLQNLGEFFFFLGLQFQESPASMAWCLQDCGMCSSWIFPSSDTESYLFVVLLKRCLALGNQASLWSIYFTTELGSFVRCRAPQSRHEQQVTQLVFHRKYNSWLIHQPGPHFQIVANCYWHLHQQHKEPTRFWSRWLVLWVLGKEIRKIFKRDKIIEQKISRMLTYYIKVTRK